MNKHLLKTAELSTETKIEGAETFVDILRWRALHQPDRCAYIFLADGEQEEVTYTYAQLDSQARSIAATLQSHIDIGERVLLLYPSGLDYIAAFMGCLYAGAIAVPAYPPASNRSIPRIQAVVADAGIRLVLTNNAVLTKMHNWSRKIPEFLELPWITTDDKMAIATSDQWEQYTPTPEKLMFLQYTSGSTDTPKGVMVSHSNLIHNSEMIRIQSDGLFTPESASVSWLPMFHDMGLILGVLQPLYSGFLGVLMAPAAFIQRPLRWLQAVSHYRATISCAPNFAYELCSSRILPEERSQLDLQSWDIAINAAEPVRAETIARFSASFASCGLKATAMAPAYGLAETTLMVACNRIKAEATVIHLDKASLEQKRILTTATAEPDKTVDIVGCGSVAKDQRVVIANPETREACLPEEIGEIWVAGPSITQGYWQRSLDTEKTFQAYLKDTHEGPFLRTGDLGFVFNGEVFVTGRLKDLIIIRGRNYYPQDIELTVERSHPSLRSDCGAAFSIEARGEERLVIIQEVVRHHEKPEAIIQTIRQVIAERYEIQAYAVVLLRYGSILKTSSGKIQRRACREAFLKEELVVVASDILEEVSQAQDELDPERQQAFLSQLEEATPEQKRELLLALVSEQIYAVLNTRPEQQIAPTQNLLSLGMDSLTGTQLMNRLQNFLRCTIPNGLAFMISEPTVDRLVDYLITEMFSHQAPTSPAEQAFKEWLGEAAALTEDEIEAQLMEQLVVFEREDIS